MIENPNENQLDSLEETNERWERLIDAWTADWIEDWVRSDINEQLPWLDKSGNHPENSKEIQEIDEFIDKAKESFSISDFIILSDLVENADQKWIDLSTKKAEIQWIAVSVTEKALDDFDQNWYDPFEAEGLHIQNAVILKWRLDSANEAWVDTSELSTRLVDAWEEVVRTEINRLLSADEISNSDMSAVDFYVWEAQKLWIDLSDIQWQVNISNRRVKSE